MKSLYSALVDFESRCSSHYVGLGINLMLYYPESEFSLGTIAALCCAVKPFIIHVVPFADDSTSPSSFVSSSPSPLSRLSRNIISGDHQRPDCRRHRWVGRVDRQKKATRLSVFPSVCRRYGAVVGGLNDLFLHHSSFLPVVYPFSLTPDLELAPTQRGEHMVSSAG